MPQVKLMGLQHKGLTKEIIFSDLGEHDPMKIIITVNAEIMVTALKQQRLAGIINEGYATFDGQVPYNLAKIKYPKANIEKISGSDLIYYICEYAARHNMRVFLLGGIEAANTKAAEILKEKYNVQLQGYSPAYKPYPWDDAHNQAILDKIQAFQPHFLLTAFGCPKQEYWVQDNYKQLQSMGVRFAIGVGGTFEFVSGMTKRAPKFIQKIMLEWAFRAVVEPARRRRLWAYVEFIYFAFRRGL